MLSISLALLIAVTSQNMAVARGAIKDANGQVVLCTGQGPVTLTMDRLGNPIEGGGALGHICPDCIVSLLAFVDAPLKTPARDIHMNVLWQTPVCTLESARTALAANARAPPVSV